MRPSVDRMTCLTERSLKELGLFSLAKQRLREASACSLEIPQGINTRKGDSDLSWRTMLAQEQMNTNWQWQ